MLQRYYDAVTAAASEPIETPETLRIVAPVLPAVPDAVLAAYVNSLHPLEAMKLAGDNHKIAFGQKIGLLLRNDQLWEQWFQRDFTIVFAQNIFPTAKHAYLWTYHAIRKQLKQYVSDKNASNRSTKDAWIYSSMKLTKLSHVHIRYILFGDEEFESRNIPLNKFLGDASPEEFIRTNEVSLAFSKEVIILLYLIKGVNGIIPYIQYAKDVERAYNQDDNDEFERLTGNNLEEQNDSNRETAYELFLYRNYYEQESDEDSEDFIERRDDAFMEQYDFFKVYKEIDGKYDIGRFFKRYFEEDGRLKQDSKNLFLELPGVFEYGVISIAKEVQ